MPVLCYVVENIGVFLNFEVFAGFFLTAMIGCVILKTGHGFKKYINFEDYNGDELYSIFNIFCTRNKYHVSEEAELKLKNYLNDLYLHRDSNFGNARDVRNLFERIITEQSNRIAGKSKLTEDELITIEEADLTNVISLN